MQYNQLGNSDLKVSKVSMGCMSLPVDDKERSIYLIQKALDEGINFFDTADLYDKGKNEEIVGEALKRHSDEVVIATKVGNQWKDDGSDWIWNPKKEYILEAVDKSLRRLQTDYIDLYQLHGGTIEDPMDETIEAFEILKEKGKIRFYGISSIRPNVIRAYIAKANITSVMMQYSLLDRRPEEECLPLLAKNNISVLTRGTLVKGLLAGKKPEAYLSHTKEEVQQYISSLKDVTHIDKPLSHTAIDYVLGDKAIGSAVIGVSNRDQICELTNYGNFPSITDDDYQLLQDTVSVSKYTKHR
ncbi:MAG: oxidoreductase [Aquimarina sp.]|nr:oxidoreductase [Aquimarina sp.]